MINPRKLNTLKTIQCNWYTDLTGLSTHIHMKQLTVTQWPVFVNCTGTHHSAYSWLWAIVLKKPTDCSSTLYMLLRMSTVTCFGHTNSDHRVVQTNIESVDIHSAIRKF